MLRVLSPRSSPRRRRPDEVRSPSSAQVDTSNPPSSSQHVNLGAPSPVLRNFRCLLHQLVRGELLGYFEALYFCVALGLLALLVNFHAGFLHPNACDNVLQLQGLTRHLDVADVVELRVARATKLWSSPSSNLADRSLETTSFDLVDSPALMRFSRERGFLVLSRSTLQRHNITLKTLNVDLNDGCFGCAPTRFIINQLVGYETIFLNSLQRQVDAKGIDGYVYSFPSRRLYNIPKKAAEAKSRWSALRGKIAAVMTSLFVMLTTSGLVTFALRRVQVRILKLSMDLRAYMLSQVSCSVVDVVLRYSMDAIVFVPIVTGIMFFLREFFDDLGLTFMVVLISWLRELVAILCSRQSVAGHYLPRVLSMYFLCFHLYFFTYPLGFRWLALLTCILFMQHSVLAIWNRCEGPRQA